MGAYKVYLLLFKIVLMLMFRNRYFFRLSRTKTKAQNFKTVVDWEVSETEQMQYRVPKFKIRELPLPSDKTGLTFARGCWCSLKAKLWLEGAIQSKPTLTHNFYPQMLRSTPKSRGSAPCLLTYKIWKIHEIVRTYHHWIPESICTTTGSPNPYVSVGMSKKYKPLFEKPCAEMVTSIFGNISLDS